MNLTKIIQVSVFFVVSAVVLGFMLVSSIGEGIDASGDVYFDDAGVSASPNEPPEKTESDRVKVDIWCGKEKMQVFAESEDTVGELLEKIEVEIGGDTVLNYDTDDEVFAGMTLTVGGHEIKTYVETQEIAFGITYVDSQNIPKGTTSLKEDGIPGSMAVTRETVTLGGELISDTVLSSVVIEDPTNAVYYKGVGGTVTAEDGTEYAFNYCMEVTATAYEAKGTTATGKEATDGIIAVDPKVIPYGTKVFVTGNYGEIGVCSAEDTGGAIKGNRIDICMSGTREQLLQFGRRKMTIYILE